MNATASGRRCGRAGCEGVLEKAEGATSEPDLWLRLHEDGTWWMSLVAPMTEFGERAGTRWYRCDACSVVILSVVGGPHGYPDV